jgi:hypothetical protein
MMIKMSVSARVYQSCQLDAFARHYGLTSLQSHRKGYWYIGPESAWRNLANDVDYRSCGQFSDGATRKSDGLHGRIDRYLAKRSSTGMKALSDMLMVAFKND